MTPTFEFRQWHPTFITTAATEVASRYAQYLKATRYMRSSEEALFEMFVHHVFPVGTRITVEDRDVVVTGYIACGTVIVTAPITKVHESQFNYNPLWGWYCKASGLREIYHFAELLDYQRGRWS